MEDVVSNEQLNVALYDDSNIIEETFIQRVNKHLQLYGLISIPFSNRKDFNLINLDNLLRFKVKREIKKEYLTLELAYLEKTGTVVTSDCKIHNLSIVSIEPSKKNCC